MVDCVAQIATTPFCSDHNCCRNCSVPSPHGRKLYILHLILAREFKFFKRITLFVGNKNTRMDIRVNARSNRHPCVNVEVVTSRSSLHSRPAKLYIFPCSVCLIFAQKKKTAIPRSSRCRLYTETKFCHRFLPRNCSFHHYLHALATARAASYTCLSFFLHAERIEIFHRTPLGNNSSKEILLPSRRCLETDIFPSRKRRRR